LFEYRELINVRENPQMPSIKDVAKLAKVSVSTVSNIINNKNNVSGDVYNRVLKVIEELNYNPNLLARNLKTNRTKFIGLILPGLYGYYNQILQGVLKITGEGDYHIIIKVTNNIKTIEDEVLDELVNLGVKGILIATCDESNIEKFNVIISKKIPIVFLERYMPGKDYTSVKFDNERIIYEAVVSILGRAESNGKISYNYITLITGPQDFSSEKDCLKGFMSACAALESRCGENIVQVHLNREHAFRDIMGYLMDNPAIPEAFIVTAEEVAEALIEALEIYGAKADIYVLSGHSWCKFQSDNRIHRINRNSYEMGSEGAKILLKYINNTLIFENRQHVIKKEAPAYEKIYIDTDGQAVSNNSPKVNLLLLEGPASDALIKLIPNFNKRYGTKVDYHKCRYTELYDRIKEASKTGTDYDVFMIDLPWLNSFIESGYLLTLDDYVDSDGDSYLDDFIDTVRDVFINSYDKIYCVPFMAASQSFFYRKDLFEDNYIKWLFYKEYGIELRPPKTWTEFNLVAKYFTRRFNSNSPTEYGTCIIGLKPTAMLEEYLPRQWAYNGKIVAKDGEFVINSIENIKALNNLCETYQYSPPGSINYWMEDQVNELVNGNVACINAFASHFSAIYDQEIQVFDKMRFDRIPGNCPILGGWALGINKLSKYPNESYRFIKWACSSMLAAHNLILGGFVPRKNIIQKFNLLTMYPWFENVAEHLSLGRKRQIVKCKNGRVLDNYTVENILAEYISSAILGKQTVEDALNSAKRRYEEIYKGLA